MAIKKYLDEIEKHINDIRKELEAEEEKQNIFRLAAKLDFIIMRAQDAKKELTK